MDEKARYEAGMKIRREVLGDAHVDRSLANRDGFNEEFQDLITRYAWGEIWTRPGLSRHTRSLIVIATTIALNRTEELRLHVRAALNNGDTREEIKEVLLPADNEPNAVADLTPDILGDMKIIYVRTLDEVSRPALAEGRLARKTEG